MKEHLTVEELLTSLKHCMGYIGGDSCIGCPNAIPETADKDGFCQCRFKTQDEMIRILESIVEKNTSPDETDREKRVEVSYGKSNVKVSEGLVELTVR